MSFEFQPTKDLQGFNLTPNAAIDYIEQENGVTFPFRPAQVEMGLRNSLVFARREGIGALIDFRKGTLGLYRSDYHAIFVRPNVGLITVLHENTHGLINSTNPYFERTMNLFTQAHRDKLLSTDEYNSLAEECTVYHCLIEGLAEWVALRTATRVPNSNITNEYVTQLANRYITGSPEGDPSEMPSEYTEGVFASVDQALSCYQSAYQHEDIERGAHILAGNKNLEIARYFAGYYFVHLTMEELVGAGIEVGKGIEDLIKHPPRKVEQLKNPLKFVESRKF